MHEHVSVSLDKKKALCILMQYEIELTYTFGISAFDLYNIVFYQMIMMWKSEFLYYSKFTLTPKIAWNKQFRYKEG